MIDDERRGGRRAASGGGRRTAAEAEQNEATRLQPPSPRHWPPVACRARVCKKKKKTLFDWQRQKKEICKLGCTDATKRRLATTSKSDVNNGGGGGCSRRECGRKNRMPATAVATAATAMIELGAHRAGARARALVARRPRRRPPSR